MMKNNIAKKIKLICLWILGAGIGLGLTLGGGFLVHLYHTPLNLKNLPPKVVSGIQAIAPHYQISFDHGVLSWKGFGHPLFIDAKNVKVLDQREKSFKVILPELKIGFSIPALLFGNFNVKTLEIIKPSLHVVHKDETMLASSFEEDDHFILTMIDDFLKERKDLKKIKQFKIIDANIRIENLKKEELLTISRVMFTVEREHKVQKFHFTGETEQDSFNLEGTWNHTLGEILADLTIKSKPLLKNPPRSSQKIPNQEGQKKENTFSVFGINFPFSLMSKIHYSETEGIKEASLKIACEKGKFNLPSTFLFPLDIEKGIFEGKYSNNYLQVEKIELQSGHSLITGRIEGRRAKQTQEMALQGNFEAANVNFNDLDKLWPKNLAIPARQWVINNITSGKATKATLTFESILEIQNNLFKFSLKDLAGLIKIKDAAVSYLEGMPPVTQVNGEARYSLRGFLIAIESGRTNHLALKGGRVDVLNLDKKEQKIDISLTIQGSLPNHISLIDHKPLEYAQQFGIRSSEVFGDAETTVQLTFPLLTTITLNDIKFNVGSKVRNAKIINIKEMLPSALSDGKFTLKVNNDAMKVEGTGILSKIPLKIFWQKNFVFQSPFDSKLDITGAINEEVFKDHFQSIVQNFEGKAPFEIHYLSKKTSQGTLSSKIDLTPINANILGWEKPKGMRGTIETSLEILNNQLHQLNFLKAHATEGLQVEGKGLFDQGELKELSFSHFRIGPTNMKFEMRRQPNKVYIITLQGSRLNLEPFLHDFSDFSEGERTTSFDLKARLKEIVLGADRSLYDSQLELHYAQNKVNHLNFRAGLSKKNPKAVFDIYLAPEDKNIRKMTLQTNYGGKFLKAFGLYDNIYEGNLDILATHDSRAPQNPWQGKFILKDFSLKKAPVFGKLLSLAFPTGMVDLFSEKGLSFSRFRCKFSAYPDKIIIKKGRTNGASLGMTFAGNIDLKRKNLHLYGSLIPAYHLNTILSKIPLIGELASGGKHEGLFSISYEIVGDSNKPEIKVNPVSIFTPGFFRKIFDPDLDDDDLDENNDDDFKD